MLVLLYHCSMNLQFYLELPSKNRKDKILDYINEIIIYNSETNGLGALSKIIDGYSFEEALEICLNMQNKEYAKRLGKSQVKTFLLIRKNDDKIIGCINIRWNLTKYMKKYSGNIGYGIRPTERNKGYNKINLYLGLLEAKKLNLNKVMLVCETNNLSSSKTIEALGGILERKEIDPNDGLLTSYYWIDINLSINKYTETYRNNIY